MVYALPSLLFATALALLPESPKFLWVRGESNQALEILKKVYACNSGNHESTYCVSFVFEFEKLILCSSGLVEHRRIDMLHYYINKNILGFFITL